MAKKKGKGKGKGRGWHGDSSRHAAAASKGGGKGKGKPKHGILGKGGHKRSRIQSAKFKSSADKKWPSEARWG